MSVQSTNADVTNAMDSSKFLETSLDAANATILELQYRLQRSEELLHKTEQLANVGVWEFLPETKEILWSEEIYRIRRTLGQLEGIETMISDRRYCPDIIQQIRAAYSAIKALELSVLRRHLKTCIRKSAREDRDAGFDRKLSEILKLIRS